MKVKDLETRIQGCWLGKSIGGTLGLPAEGKMQRQNLTFYDPIPLSAPPNDDLELQLVWLHLLEHGGRSLTRAEFAQAWIDHIHYMWDEYGRCRWNLRRGVSLESVGTFENPFHAAMGAPIRSEIWACLFPGNADSAAHYAALDASLDHGVEGIAGEVLFAVMQSTVAAGKSLEEGIGLAMGYIPADCETARAIAFIRERYLSGMPEWDCWKELLTRHGSENFTHAPLNVALTLWALWYGAGDFEKSILLAVNAGYDTDCTAATVGATLGFISGADGIPSRWSLPIGEGVHLGPGIQGINAPKDLGELTRRVSALTGKLECRCWDGSLWTTPPPPVDVEQLPGSIALTPLGGCQPVVWANGELPPEVKAAGGAEWTWEVGSDEPRQIAGQARHGTRLFLDGTLISEGPANLPYTPTPHRRCTLQSGTVISPGRGTHRVRLELNRCDANQEAAVLLAYPNKHLAPWTAGELPHLARLP